MNTSTVYLVAGHNGRQIQMAFHDWYGVAGVGLPFDYAVSAMDRKNFPFTIPAELVKEVPSRLQQYLDFLPREEALGRFLGPIVTLPTSDGRYPTFYLTEKASWVEIDDRDMIFFDCFPDDDLLCPYGREFYQEVIDFFSNGAHVNVFLEDVQRKAIKEQLMKQGLPDKPVLWGSLPKDSKQEGIWLLQSLLRKAGKTDHLSREDILEEVWDVDVAEMAIIGMQTDLNIMLEEQERASKAAADC